MTGMDPATQPYPAATDSAMRPVVLGMLGAGIVGGGVIQLLAANAELYAHKLQRPLLMKRAAVRDPAKARDFPHDPGLLTADWQAVVNDPEIQIVIELMGGEEPARTAILQ